MKERRPVELDHRVPNERTQLATSCGSSKWRGVCRRKPWGHLHIVDRLAAKSHQRIPRKNGRGELILIAREGGNSWADTGEGDRIAWHFGRTNIVEEGPFSDYTGYERLQVVMGGAGLVLVAPDHEIDLRVPMRPQRYDGGTPIRTRLEQGPVEVVNLIALRTRFDIDMRIGQPDRELECGAGNHVVYAPAGPAQVRIGNDHYSINKDEALRIQTSAPIGVTVQHGNALVGSIHAKG